MTELKKLSMSELIAKHNELASALRLNPVTEFKNLNAARNAVESLEKKMSNTDVNTVMDGATPIVEGAAAPEKSAADITKYNSTDKRGPNQGVGAFAKEQLVAGKNNADTLAAVIEKFSTAKTTLGCIAYYRTALSKGKPKVDPASLRTKALELIAQAEAAEKAAAAAAAAAAAEAAITITA
jgi:hypothetical protein